MLIHGGSVIPYLIKLEKLKFPLMHICHKCIQYSRNKLLISSKNSTVFIITLIHRAILPDILRRKYKTMHWDLITK